MKIFKKLSVNYDHMAEKFEDNRERAIFKAGMDAGRHEESMDSTLKTFIQASIFLAGFALTEWAYKKWFRESTTDEWIEEFYDDDQGV